MIFIPPTSRSASPSTPLDVPQAVRTLQNIAAALMSGGVAFAVIAVFVVGGKPGLPVIALVFAVLVAFEIPPFVLLPAMILKRPQGESFEIGRELQRYQTATILRYALCEGGAFANLVAYIVAGQWWSLAIVGALWFVMIAMFPTRTKVAHWLETRRMEAGDGYNGSSSNENRS